MEEHTAKRFCMEEIHVAGHDADPRSCMHMVSYVPAVSGFASLRGPRDKTIHPPNFSAGASRVRGVDLFRIS